MRRRSSLAVLLFVGVGGVLSAGVSCTASPSKVLPLGAGLDAYPPPRYPDDASSDARRPPVGDAAPWTGEIPIPGEWLPVPELPATCSVRIAKDPKVSASRLPWKPCANARSGCEVFLADWGVDSQWRFLPERLDNAFEDAAGVHLTYRRYLAPDTGASQVVAQLLNGEAEATWFSGPNCILSASRSRHGFALSIVDVVATGTPERTVQQFLAWSTSLNPLRFEYVEESLTPSLKFSQGVARGANFLTLEATNGGTIVASAFRFSDRQFARSTPANDLDAARPLPATGGYVSLVGSDPPTLAFMPLEGGYRTLVRPTPAYFVSDLKLDRANGAALVWTEAEFADDYHRILWTSPFANTEAGVVRRRIARFDQLDSYVANAGVVVGRIRESRNARIVRLSDGMGWDIESEPGTTFVKPIWINDDSVWMVISKADPRTPNLPRFSGALRIRRSTLGPATVPNGL